MYAGNADKILAVLHLQVLEANHDIYGGEFGPNLHPDHGICHPGRKSKRFRHMLNDAEFHSNGLYNDEFARR